MKREKPGINVVAFGIIIGASLGMLIGTLFMGGDNLALAIVVGAALGIVVTARLIA